MYKVVWADIIADSSKFFLFNANSFCINMFLTFHGFDTLTALPVHYVQQQI